MHIFYYLVGSYYILSSHANYYSLGISCLIYYVIFIINAIERITCLSWRYILTVYIAV